MGFSATVLKVFIASPGDTVLEREEIENIIYEWNIRNAERENVFLQPVRWEKSISPEYSTTKDGQEIINERILKDSDMIVMVFKSKLGSPTKRFESGSLEELEYFSKDNADNIGIFFCETVAPTTSAGHADNGKLVEFRERLKNGYHGLYGDYNTRAIEDFLMRQVEKYKTTINIAIEQEKNNNTGSDRSFIIINALNEEYLRPDEILFLKYIYEEGRNIIELDPYFAGTYSTFLKYNGYKEHYSNSVFYTCNRLLEREILEFAGTETFYDYNTDYSEEYSEYKLNIKTFDSLGKIFKNYKNEIAELLQQCRAYDVSDNDLPF